MRRELPWVLYVFVLLAAFVPLLRKKDITIRTLAEDRLADLTSNPRCAPKLRQRLQDALRSE